MEVQTLTFYSWRAEGTFSEFSRRSSTIPGMDIGLKHPGFPASHGENQPTMGKACFLLSSILWDLWAWPMLG